MALFNKKKSDDIERIRQNSMGGVFKSAGIVALVMVIVLLASQSAYQIREQEQAVLTTFGKAQAVTTPGLHFKIPFIQNVTKVNTTIKGFSIGYDEATDEVIEEEAIMITSDYNFIDVDFFIEYKVSDPVKAIYASENPTLILKNIAQVVPVRPIFLFVFAVKHRAVICLHENLLSQLMRSLKIIHAAEVQN